MILVTRVLRFCACTHDLAVCAYIHQTALLGQPGCKKHVRSNFPMRTLTTLALDSFRRSRVLHTCSVAVPFRLFGSMAISHMPMELGCWKGQITLLHCPMLERTFTHCGTAKITVDTATSIHVEERYRGRAHRARARSPPRVRGKILSARRWGEARRAACAAPGSSSPPNEGGDWSSTSKSRAWPSRRRFSRIPRTVSDGVPRRGTDETRAGCVHAREALLTARPGGCVARGDQSGAPRRKSGSVRPTRERQFRIFQRLRKFM